MSSTSAQRQSQQNGNRTASENAGVEIVLDHLTKRYPGATSPAVDDVQMTIPAGELVVFVGPSGCGKTTTMKMINRIIEPTEGRIMLGGEDVTRINGDELRRRIGYVIQQIGLFPHMTIAENVAIVPKMLGWDKRKIDNRVEELLNVTGLDPAMFGSRYPKQLSGGQQQRVGVARALAADPPVMLMDEPFGATDPITREKLQQEFLRLQEELGKTIVFVTHDFEEAVKLGDRIAVLKEQSHIAQFDTPGEILTNPADDYVASFIGAAPSLKRLDLQRLSRCPLESPLSARVDERPADVVNRLEREPDDAELVVVDEQGRPRRWVDLHDLRRDSSALTRGGRAVEPTVETGDTLRDALDALLRSSGDTAVVVDRDGSLAGIVGLDAIMAAVREDVGDVACVTEPAREGQQA